MQRIRQRIKNAIQKMRGGEVFVNCSCCKRPITITEAMQDARKFFCEYCIANANEIVDEFNYRLEEMENTYIH